MNDSGNTEGSHMPPDWPSGGLGGAAPLVSVLAREAWWMASRDGRSPWKGQLTMAPSPTVRTWEIMVF